MVQACFVVQAAVVGQAFQPAAGFRAGLGAPYRPPLLVPIAPYSAATLRVRPSWTLPHRPLRGARSPACHTGCSRGASRQACHAGGHAGRATQSRMVREFQRHPARTPARSTPTRRRKVEQAARLAMPAVTPAEPHNPERYGRSKRQPPPRLVAWHARLRTPPPAAPFFPSPCPPWFSFLISLRALFFLCVLRVLCGLFFSVSSVPSVVCLLRVLCGLFFLCPPCRVRCGAGFLACGRLSSRPGPPLPTALCDTQCRAV